MPVRRTIEMAVGQDPDGTWRQREILLVQKWRVRVVSDRSRGRSHQHGHGEDFELAIDTELRIWARPYGSDEAFRQESDAAAVSLTVVENVTGGISHEISFQERPATGQVRWICSCNASARGWLDAETARKQAETHRMQMIERDQASEKLAQIRRAARERALQEGENS